MGPKTRKQELFQVHFHCQWQNQIFISLGDTIYGFTRKSFNYKPGISISFHISKVSTAIPIKIYTLTEEIFKISNPFQLECPEPQCAVLTLFQGRYLCCLDTVFEKFETRDNTYNNTCKFNGDIKSTKRYKYTDY